MFFTLPVTTSTTERSFLVLRRLKTYLRATMREDRLNGLALGHIYKDKDVDTLEVIKFICSSKATQNGVFRLVC